MLRLSLTGYMTHRSQMIANPYLSGQNLTLHCMRYKFQFSFAIAFDLERTRKRSTSDLMKQNIAF